MHQIRSFHGLKWTGLGLCACLVAAAGLQCPGPGGEPPVNPPPAGGNTAPRLIITNIITDQGNFQAQKGDPVVIQFIGEDAEDAATVRIFASSSGNPTPEQEVEIGSGFQVGPGFGSGSVVWDTENADIGAYNIFGEIDDHTFDPVTGIGNPPVRVTFSNLVSISPRGSQPLTTPPKIEFVDPRANLGLSTGDEITVRYVVNDPDSNMTVTLMLDKDRIPTNDDVENPGDPLDPTSNIIILPSTIRLPNDPVFPTQADTDELRTNPRTFNPTPPGSQIPPGATIQGELKEYRFVIDFAQIPVRAQPYFMRATISDGGNVVHQYAVGSLTISSLASGTVDTAALGFSLAGARFQGFSEGENLGTSILALGDMESDGVEDFMLAGRYASPRNRFQSGGAYLIFGRRKTPFPPDTNNNGIPDVTTPGGTVDFPAPPTYLPNPYDSTNVGRFGGIININSVASFFRGTTYGMPRPRTEFLFGDLPVVPSELADNEHPDTLSAGLTSITRIDMTGDGIKDFFFGLPFVGGAYDNVDTDPGDTECTLGYGDTFPIDFSTPIPNNDDLGASVGGLVIMVDGTNDIRNLFRQFTDASIAGQYDPGPPPVITDDEGFLQTPATTPEGARIRGAWQAQRTYDPNNQYGRTVAAMPSFDNDLGDDLIISIPGFSFINPPSFPGSPPPVVPDKEKCGKVEIWNTGNFTPANDNYTTDGVRSFPKIDLSDCGGEACIDLDGPGPGDTTQACRGPGVEPGSIEIVGAAEGDQFGYAGPAGQFNQDGTQDVLAGAPMADRNNLTDNGIFYVLFTPAGGFGNTDLTVSHPPRMEILGSHNNDHFGRIQTTVRDINGGGIDDVAFASPDYDDANVGVDAGYVGVIFGNRPLTGENGFSPEQVGTSALAGVRFIGPNAGARAGAGIASAGDFNQDGFGDLIVTCPNESRGINGQNRKGVAYLIFGGTHLNPHQGGPAGNKYSLSQVGVADGQGFVALPGIVFISRFQQGTIDEAPLETCGGVGDVDGDGFDDIMIGAPHADFVNLASPDQRRPDAGEAYLIYGSNFGSNNLGG